MNAVDALKLPRAQLSAAEKKQLGERLREVFDHIPETMTFAGPAPLKITYAKMATSVAKALASELNLLKWNVQMQLQARPPMIPGGEPILDHWILTFSPTPEAYTEVYPNGFVAPSSLLM